MGNIYLTSAGVDRKGDIGFNLIKDKLKGQNLAEKRILGMTLRDYDNADKLIAQFTRLGFQKDNIDIYDGENEVDLNKRYDYIYIGEGNTYEMLYKLRLRGVNLLIEKCLENGGSYIGASAGALIASPTIKYASEYDSNWRHLEDMTGLSLVKGLVMPHMNEQRFKEWNEGIMDYLLEKYEFVVNIPEDGMLEF